MRNGTLRFCLLLSAILLNACGGEEPGGGEQIRAFTQQMQWFDGFVPFYHDAGKGRIYLLLDTTNEELLYQESLPRGIGSNDIGLDRGQLGADAALVRFEAAGDKVLLRQQNLRYRADSANDAERSSAQQAFATSVLWGFPVVARDGPQRLVDATDFLLRDTHGAARRLKAMGEGSFKVDPSRSAVYLPRSKAFPKNTELEAVVTLTGNDPGVHLQSVVPDPHAITVHMHHSFIELPDGEYAARRFHPQSGYWSVTYADYAAAIDDSLEQRWIPRHRLKKTTPGAALSGVKEPIVYYLDPGTPEPVRSALIEGAAWWAQAFEAAGFQDAFRVELLPEDVDPMDVRYNVINWVHRSTRGWSYGSSVKDPRTGEIIKGQVTLGSLRVRQDLLIARGLTSPFADGGSDEQAMEMALARIRQLSAHEVGHTLGLAHNFTSSAKDRSSVMDYPHPVAALESDDQITLAGAYATDIGAWDKRAIIYGYADFGAEDEAEALSRIISENRDLGFEFITDPDSRLVSDFHPRSHLWDNGADPLDELQRVLRLRNTALESFGPASLPKGSPFSDLQEALVPIYFYHRYQLEAVAKLVGGADYSYAMRENGLETAVIPVVAEQQRLALQGLSELLHPSNWVLRETLVNMIPPKAYGYRRNRESAPSRTGALFDPLTLAEAGVEQVITALLHPQRLARLSLQHARDQGQLSPSDLLTALHEAVLIPEHKGLEAGVDKRAISVLLAHWRSLLGDASLAPEVRADVRAALDDAHRLLRARQRKTSAYQNMYRYQMWLINEAFEGRYESMPVRDVAVPPGSPIGAGQ